MPEGKVKDILLYDLRRVRPDVIEAMAAAPHGGAVPVEGGEMDSFKMLTLADGEAERMYEEKTGLKMPRKAARKK